MKVIGIIWSVVQVFKLEAVDYKDKQILSNTTVIQVNLNHVPWVHIYRYIDRIAPVIYKPALAISAFEILLLIDQVYHRRSRFLLLLLQTSH